jgi:hypothetical protein
MSFPKVKLQAQPVCYFLDAPVIANRISGRRNHRRLPPVSMVFSNTDRHPANAQCGDDHVR